MSAKTNYKIISVQKLVEFIKSIEDYDSKDILSICVFFNRDKCLEKTRTDIWNNTVIDTVYFEPLAISLRKRDVSIEFDVTLLISEFGRFHCCAFNKNRSRQLDQDHVINMLEICPRAQSFEYGNIRYYPSRIYHYPNYQVTLRKLAKESKDDEVFSFGKKSAEKYDSDDSEDEAFANL